MAVEKIVDLGPLTAYDFAVEGGYEGTEEEFEEGLAESAEYAENAAASATAAAGSATGAAGSARDSEAWAVGQRGGVDVESDDETYENNAKYYAEQAGGSATSAAGSATSAASSASSVASSAAQITKNADDITDLKSALNERFDGHSYNILYFPEWEKGMISSSTGEDVAGNNNARSRRYIDVLPSTQYTGSWDGSGFTCYVYFYSSESESGYISHSAIYASGRQFTTPENAIKIRVVFYKANVTDLNSLIPNKAQINQGATAKDYISGECINLDYINIESINGNKLVPGTIKNRNLEDGSIYGEKIADRAITTRMLNDKSVTFLKTDFYQTDGNLFDGSFSFGLVTNQGEIFVTNKSNAVSTLIDLSNESTVYTLVSTVGTGIVKYIHWYASDGTSYLGYIMDVRQTGILPCVAPAGARYMRIGTYKEGETVLANLTPTGIRLLASGLPTPETTGVNVLGKAYYTNNFANQSPTDATIRGIAHKGLCAEAPENTSAAFVAARKKGFRYIETDVRKTSDGHYVLIHDQTVNRTTDGTGNVADKTLAQLQTLDAGSWFGSAFAGEKILSLEEACVLFRKLNLIPYLELKYKPSDVTEAQAMNEIVKKSGIKYIWLGDAPDYALFKQADPKISFCFLASVVPSAEAYQIIVNELNSGMDVMISLEKTALTTAFAEQCARDGIKFDTYTVNDVDEMKTITSTYAVNGILSDGFHVDAILQKYEF